MDTEKKKLTKKIVDEATYVGDAHRGERHVIWDTELSGFGLRVYPTGKKAFILSYRHNGRKRLITLGQYGSITPDQARIEAKKHHVEIIQGRDPLEERQKARSGDTIKDLCVAYIERHASKKKSAKDDIRRIERHIVPAWGSLKANAIKRADVAALHSKIGKNNGQYEANRVLALISKMFSLAELWGIVDEGHSNPARGVEKFKEEKRDRYVTPEEMPKLIKAIQNERNEFARYGIWLYLLTGLRKEELLQAQWDDIDYGRNEIKIKETKKGNKHYVPLSAFARELLDNITRIEGNPFIIVGKNPGAHLVNIDKPWQRVRKAAGIEDVRIHDLRRTVGSWLAQAGNSLHLIGRVLNHSNTSTTAIYARFGQDSVREALDRHGEQILATAGVTQNSEIISI
ncbi:MAG: tyrosine-type recombinase/integrase [Methylomicrobium sp.]